MSIYFRFFLNKSIWVFILPTFIIIVFYILVISTAAAQVVSVESGNITFRAKCSACHTIGGGDLVGPDLKNVTYKREHDWLVRFLREPDKVIAEDDPIAKQLLEKYKDIRMPNQGLSSQEIDNLIAYIVNKSGVQQVIIPEQPADKPPEQSPVNKPPEQSPVNKPPEQPGIVGSASNGESLILGNTPFKNGAPPCQACHNIQGLSLLGGGSLGPDLTKVYDRYGGDRGLSSILSVLPFPTMSPIYSNHPLTSQEQADLKEFFKLISTREVQRGSIVWWGLAEISLVMSIVLVEYLWRRRLLDVRQPLIKQVVHGSEEDL